MASISSTSAVFPRTVDSPQHECGVDTLRLRAFGLKPEDLDVDFGDPNLPRLEIAILTRCARAECGEDPGSEFFANLEVGQRAELLLKLMTLDGRPVMDVQMRCANPSCNEPMEVELEVDELTGVQRTAEAAGRPAVMIGGERVLFRRPTGADQAAWQRIRYPDERSAGRALAESLVLDEFRLEFRRLAANDESWVELIGQAMQDADPLVNFNMQVNCPFCGEQNSYKVDLIDQVIRRLRVVQQNLAAMVHRLASQYHWSEAEIFAVAPWRRERYLALIDREESR